MSPSRLERLLPELEAARYHFGPGDAARIGKLLHALDQVRFNDPTALIRFHEALMFVRAFPPNAAVLRAAERILNHFHKKVEALLNSGADADAFDTYENSGIAGTTMEDTLSFDVARWLVCRLPSQVEIAWENYEPGRELGTTGPRFMPLLEDDAFVEADTPFRRWLEAASDFGKTKEFASQTALRTPSHTSLGPPSHTSLGTPSHTSLGPTSQSSVETRVGGSLAAERRKNAAHGASRGYQAELSIQPRRGERNRNPQRTTAQWLIDRFESLDLPPLQKAELYESLRIPLRWHLRNSPITRTRNWQSPRKVFYHHGPLISRSQVSLADQLAKRPPHFKRLSLKEGTRIADMIREVMLVRYRELYGTTLADPGSVVRVDLGGNTGDDSSRGIEIYLWNLPPNRRLPLRAYVAGFTLKNGVPINYVEAIGLCEWMEVGFNTFYTFRGGEAGWIYAQALRALRAWMGTSVISVYPYQLGHENDEAIDSGAFWFYRKLGFRPSRTDLLELVQREEKKIAANSTYRTLPRTLKHLAASHVFYDVTNKYASGVPFKPGFGLSASGVPQVRARSLRVNLGGVRSEPGVWDTFSTRNIGLRVNERMARQFAGDADAMRAHARRDLSRSLGLPTGSRTKASRLTAGGPPSFTPLELQAFDNFALILSLDPQFPRWTSTEKEDLLRIIRAKSKSDELLYLHLTQRHPALRRTFLKLGSSPINER